MNNDSLEKNVSKNFFNEMFQDSVSTSFMCSDKKQSMFAPCRPETIKPDASIVSSQNYFLKDAKNISAIIQLIREAESLPKTNVICSQIIEAWAHLYARELFGRALFLQGIFLPDFFETFEHDSCYVMILTSACIVFIDNIQPSERLMKLKKILSYATTEMDLLSREALAVLKICIESDHVITLTEEEKTTAFKKACTTYDEMISDWKRNTSYFRPFVFKDFEIISRELPPISTSIFVDHESEKSVYSQFDFEEENDAFNRIISAKTTWNPLKYYFSVAVYDIADSKVSNCEITRNHPDLIKRETCTIATNYLILILNNYLKNPIQRLGSSATLENIGTVYQRIISLEFTSYNDISKRLREEMGIRAANILLHYYVDEISWIANYLIKTNQATDQDALQKLIHLSAGGFIDAMACEALRLSKSSIDCLEKLFSGEVKQELVKPVVQTELKLPLELYQAADSSFEKCFSTIDSIDPRLSAISKLSTEYITEILEETLRKPLFKETQLILKTKPKTDKLLFRFSHETVPPLDQNRFVKINDGKSGDRLILAQTTSLQCVAKSFYPLLLGSTQLYDTVEMLEASGPCLRDDLESRIRNILATRYLPESTCLDWMIENKKMPQEQSTVSGEKEFFSMRILVLAVANEAFRRMRDSGKFDRTWTEALIPLFLKKHSKGVLSEAWSLGATLDYPLKISTW